MRHLFLVRKSPNEASWNGMTLAEEAERPHHDGESGGSRRPPNAMAFPLRAGPSGPGDEPSRQSLMEIGRHADCCFPD